MILEEMFNRGSLEVAAEIFAADFVDRRHEQVAVQRENRRALKLREHFLSLAKEIEGWQRI